VISNSRALIFHSKLPSNLSNQRSELDGNDQKNKLSSKLSSESRRKSSFEFRSGPSLSSNQLTDCYKAQNGQKSLTNNQIIRTQQTINSQQTSTKATLLQTMSNDKNEMKSASIFTSRTVAQSTKLSKAKIKTIKVTLVVIICYISCSLPFTSVQIWANFWPNAQTSSYWKGPLITITMLLPSLNSVLNPFIYLLLNRNLLYTLLKLIFGSRCVPNESKYQNENTNQRPSISMNKSTLQPIGGSTNSPTTSLLTSGHLANSGSASGEINSRLKSRLKRNSQSMRSEKQIDLNDSSSPMIASDKQLKKVDKNRKLDLESVDQVARTVETIASLNLLNQINVEKCTAVDVSRRLTGMQISKFKSLPRVLSDTLTIQTKDQQQQQFNYQTSSSAPDLKLVNKSEYKSE